MNAVKKASVCVLVAFSIIAITSVQAHHSYAQYDRTKEVSITGQITQVSWVNPHVIINVQTQAAEAYTIEWQNSSALEKARVLKENIVVGDSIVLRGIRNRDPAIFTMTLIKEITVPAKNWHWVKPSNP